MRRQQCLQQICFDLHGPCCGVGLVVQSYFLAHPVAVLEPFSTHLYAVHHADFLTERNDSNAYRYAAALLESSRNATCITGREEHTAETWRRTHEDFMQMKNNKMPVASQWQMSVYNDKRANIFFFKFYLARNR